MKAAYHVLRYLQHDPTLGVFINNRLDITISAYCDSNWASCPKSRKLVSGYLALMGDMPISWKSKKQPIVSLSSAEAEYRAMRQVVGEVVWLERLLGELSMTVPLPIHVCCDSQAAVHIAKNPAFHERTKHIEVDCHFVRTKLQEGLITLQYVSTDSQLADVFTKALTGVKHSNLLNKLSVNSSLPT